MINTIIELLPSINLKEKIKSTNHQFNENEFLQIISTYAPSFDDRLMLLEQFAKISSPKISTLAMAYIAHEKELFNNFIKNENGFVYELCILESPDSYKEKYLCSSYNSVLECIDKFYVEYAEVDAKETDETRYEIIKRKVFSAGDSFEEDSYLECTLGPNKTVLKLYDYKESSDCDKDVLCSECTEICIHRCDDIMFPCFACNYDIIKYYDHSGKKCFGVNICCHECDGLASAFYVIPLDSSIIRERHFDESFNAHIHIELPNATLATPEELDEVMRKNYFDFIEFLESNK